MSGQDKRKDINIYTELREYFNNAGFNLVLSVRGNDYDTRVGRERAAGRLLPQAKSIILVGFGGKEFWDVLNKFLSGNPSLKEKSLNIIDDYTRLVFKNASPVMGKTRENFKYVFPFGTDGAAMDFMSLGEACGAGVRSLLGILIHPEYGPWISLRGAILTEMKLPDYDAELRGYSPCPSCSKPCIRACPAETVNEEGWDWKSCMGYRVGQDGCASSCASRAACPVGAEHRYTDDQMLHHHRYVLKSVKEYYGTPEEL